MSNPSCPNIYHPNWKKLTDKVPSNIAHAVWHITKGEDEAINNYLQGLDNISASADDAFNVDLYEADVISVFDDKVWYTTDPKRAKNPNLKSSVDKIDLQSSATNPNTSEGLYLIDKNSKFFEKIIEIDYTVNPEENQEQETEDNPIGNTTLENAEKAFTDKGVKIVIAQFDNTIRELRRAKNTVENKPKSDLNTKIIYGYDSKINELIDLKKTFIRNTTLDNIISFAAILEKHLENIIKLKSEQDLEMIVQVSSFLEALYNIKGSNIIFNSDFFVLEENRKKINERYLKVSSLLEKKDAYVNDVIVNFVKKNTSGTSDLDINEILNVNKDIGFGKQYLLDLSKVNQPLIQALYAAINKASSASKQEATAVFEKLDELERKARIKAKALGTDLDELMRQKDGQYYTGKTTSIFSSSYWGKVSGLAPAAHVMFMMDNEIVFDPAILFNDIEQKMSTSDLETYPDSKLDEMFNMQANYSSETRAKHIKELKETLGEDYDYYYKKAQENFIHYLQNREIVFSVIEQNKELSKDEIIEKKREWILENSPINLAKTVQSRSSTKDFKKSINYRNAIRKFSVHVPRRTIKDVNTEYYDKSYDTIRKNKELRDYHNFYIKTLNGMTALLPPSKRKFMGENSIPYLKAQLMDKLADGNPYTGKQAFRDLKETALNSIASSVASTNLSEKVDLVTGKVTENFQLNDLGSIDLLAEQKFEEALALYYTKEKRDMPIEQQKLERKKIVDKIARENTTDTVKLLRIYTGMSLAYKHKEGLETLVNIVREKIHTANSDYTNRQQQVKVNSTQETGKKAPLYKLAELLDYTISTVYYGKSPTIEEGVGTKKRYTAQEDEEIAVLKSSIAEAKKQLEELSKVDMTLLTEQETEIHEEKAKKYEESIEILQKSIDSKGRVVVLSKIVDNYFLKWFRSISLGYNITGAIFNAGMGYMSNWVAAANNFYFDDDNLELAYVKMRNSYSTKDGIDKRRSLMKLYNVLKKSADEVDRSNKEGKLGRKFKTFRERGGLYAFMNQTEAFNQTPILYAMLLKEKIKDKDGKEHTLYDAYGPDGKLKEEFRTEENIKDWEVASADNKYTQLKLKIDLAIASTHGNYNVDAPIIANRQVFTRSVIMFRKWMFEGFNNRMRTEEYDNIMGKTVKGRYRSGFAMYIGDSAFKNSETSLVDKVKLMTESYMKLFVRQTLRSIPGVTLSDNMNKKLSPDLDQYLNEVDAANVRANMIESVFLLQLMAVSSILYAIAKGDEDDEDKKISLLNISINIVNRLSSDLSFYFNPNEGIRIIDAFVPAMGLLNKIQQFGETFFREEYELQTGQYEGMDARVVRGGQLLPIVSKYYANLTLSDDIRNKTIVQQAIDNMVDEE